MNALFEECPLLNSSICTITVPGSEDSSNSIRVIAYNSLAWKRKEPIRVPLAPNAATEWTVTDPGGDSIAYQLVSVSETTTRLQQIMLDTDNIKTFEGRGTQELVFVGETPPLGFSIFTLSPKSPSGDAESQKNDMQPEAKRVNLSYSEHSAKQRRRLTEAPSPDDWKGIYPVPKDECNKGTVTLDNGNIRINFNAETGRLKSIENLDAGFSILASHTLEWYRSYDAGAECCYNDFNPSGAYLFRPNATEPLGKFMLDEDPVKTTLVQGDVVQEFSQEYADWASVTWRLFEGAQHIEMEWTIGPIPIDDGVGKEVISRFNTSLETGDIIYTDSNGREMLKRKLNTRKGFQYKVEEPITANYYPITAAMYIKQESTGHQPGVEFAILPDRSHGGSSLASGVVETMLHRRQMVDDWRGVDENLNETMCGCRDCDCVGLVARGVQYISLQQESNAHILRRELQQRLNDPLILGFNVAYPPTKANQLPSLTTQWSMLMEPATLPVNVHLLTLKDDGNGKLLLRLAHLFQVNEDSELSQPVTVDLTPLLGEGNWTMTELTVSTAHIKSDVSRLNWKIEKHHNEKEMSSFEIPRNVPVSDSRSRQVKLSPMEIKTLQITC